MIESLRISVVWTFEKVLRMLPRKFRHGIGRILIFVLYRLLGLRKELVLENIARAFPEWPNAKIESTANQCYRFYANCIMDFLKIPETLENTPVKSHGLKNLEPLRENGGILLSGHVGFWEAGLAEMASRLDDIWIYADEQTNPYADKLITEIRSEWGVRSVTGTFGLRKLVNHVSDGGVAGLAADQRARKSSYTVDFFGTEIASSPILPIIADHTECPIVPFAMFRFDDHYEMYVSEPLAQGTRDKHEYSTNTLLRDYYRWLETEIRRHPYQYFWFHNRWKD